MNKLEQLNDLVTRWNNDKEDREWLPCLQLNSGVFIVMVDAGSAANRFADTHGLSRCDEDSLCTALRDRFSGFLG